MKAAVWRGVGLIDCEEWPEPCLRDDQVIVAVAYCGLCGSDAHIIDGHLPIGDPPQVIGHEVSGVISAVGEAVRGLEPGMRVACNFYGYCGACDPCRSGHPNLCRRKFFSAKGLAEQAAYLPQQVFVLPDEVSLEHGALLEPVATSLHAIDISELGAGETCAILGAGAIGLLLVQLARRAGAAKIVIVEPSAGKRELALRLGADAALEPKSVDPEVLAAEYGARGGFDVVFEASGSRAAAETALSLPATRGRIVLVGIFAPQTTIPMSPYALFKQEASIRSSNAAGRVFLRSRALLPLLDLDSMITAVEPIERIAAVYERHKAGEAVKQLVRPAAS